MNENYITTFVRVPPDDPNRCQAMHSSMQCPYRAVGTYDSEFKKWEGPKFCPRHVGQGLNAERAKEQKMYLLAKWQDRISQQAEHPKLKSLNNEVGIIRMMLETKLNQLKDDQELIMHAGQIVSLVTSIKDIVKTHQNLEERSGQVIDRQKIGMFVQDLLEILQRYINDPEILQMIGEDIGLSIDTLMRASTDQRVFKGQKNAT